MSPAGPQQSEPTPGNSAARALGKLRKLPGFTTAAVAFLLIVLLGFGGAAVAKWSQSATATIAITAGAAPTTSPPTTAPPPNTQGNIVANPVIAARPLLMSPANITCAYRSNQSDLSGEKLVDFRFSWPTSGNATSYVTSLNSDIAGFGYRESRTVSGTQVDFTLERKSEARGNYIFRIQPMMCDVAGDPIYRTMQHNAQLKANCYDARPTAVSPAGRSPLGTFSVNAVPASSEKTNNVLNVSWTALAAGTNYKVSIVSVDTASNYGAEFTTTNASAILTFPAYKLDGAGNPTNGGAFNGEYLMRVIPMSGTQAGDPVYKKVFYKAYDFRVEHFQYQY